MNYEKKYKEALERAKEKYAMFEGMKQGDVLEDVFPELKERDERIRKRIILCLEECVHSDIIRDYEKEQCLAWLEKQGEQNPVDDKDAEKASEEYRNFRMSCGIKDPVMLNEIEEAYYEGAIRKQKTVEWSEEDEKMINKLLAVVKLYYDRDGDDLDKQSCISWLKSIRPQPKQEFDKEKQETLHFILEDLCDQLDDTSDEGDREFLNREIAFLRSLEPQPKYRWSAEDNKIRAQITKYFECQMESEPTRKDVLLKWIAWVANLRPQSQWKPSEVQMKCLKDACDKHWEPDGLDPLYTLYEQLKAL